MLPLIHYSKTDIGMERTSNEDSVASLVINSQSLKNEFQFGILVVADGMGGLNKGDLASRSASKKFIEEITEYISKHRFENEEINFKKLLTKAIEAANEKVWAISEKQTNRVGTTLVGAIIANNHVYVANVGDSRAYLVRTNNSIQQISKDHSAVQEMLENKVITKEQAINHPRRNILTRALGLTESVTPDFFEQAMNDETLILCSDGLYTMLDEKDIAETINKNIYTSAEELIALANKHGGSDNISVAIARYNA